MNGPVWFLILLALIALIGKNSSLLIAAGVLLFLKFTGLDTKVFPFLDSKGLNLGVTIITIAVLVPIASGAIGFKELEATIKSPAAWIALASGIAVALIAKNGLVLLVEEPHITTALVFGTIIAVVLFKGVAVGPLIAAGIAYIFMQIFSFLK